MSYIRGKKIIFASASMHAKDVGENGGVRDNISLSSTVINTISLDNNRSTSVNEIRAVNLPVYNSKITSDGTIFPYDISASNLETTSLSMDDKSED